MLRFKDQRILIIAPHPDDEVFGCGGIINRCKREGGEVHVLFLAAGTARDFSEKGVSTGSERMKEIETVAKFLKFDSYAVAFPGNKHHLRLDALPQRELIHAIERGEKVSFEALKPTMVITTLPNDYNQDHRAANYATVAAARPLNPAFKSIPKIILQYELPSNAWTVGFAATPLNVFIALTEEDINAKVRAVELYPSQMKDPTAVHSPDGIRVLARLRGLQTGVAYAEAFAGNRIIM